MRPNTKAKVYRKNEGPILIILTPLSWEYIFFISNLNLSSLKTEDLEILCRCLQFAEQRIIEVI